MGAYHVTRKEFLLSPLVLAAGSAARTQSIETPNGRRFDSWPWKYAPTRGQLLFHASTSEYKLFAGPYASGKTCALIYEALFSAAANPGKTGLLYAPTFPFSVTDISAILIREGIQFKHLRNELSFTLPNAPFYGAKIICSRCSYEPVLAGLNLAWFGMDQFDSAPDIWAKLKARVRVNLDKPIVRGFATVTCGSKDKPIVPAECQIILASANRTNPYLNSDRKRVW